MQSVTLPGGDVEYQFIPGARDKPVLVFLHEGLGCVAQWRDFPAQVAQACGLPALVYSRIGYGGSSPCALPRPITYMHDEAEHGLPDLLRALNIDDYILIGHSDGASIALIHAGSSRPGLRGLAVMAPHSFAEDISIRSIAAANIAYRKGDLRTRLMKYHGTNVDCAFHGWCDSWLNPDFRQWNIEHYLDAIDKPLLAIQGEADEYGTLAQIDCIMARVQGAQKLILPECGHSPQRDKPAETLAALQAFVAGLV